MTINSYIGVKETKSRFLSLSLPSVRKLGHTHSVFKTSFNVEVDKKLFNFSQQGMSLSAHGCMLDKETMTQLLESCQPGDIVRVYDGIFTFYTSKGVFKVDVSQMKEIDLSIPKLNCPIKELSQTETYSALDALNFKDHIGLHNEAKTEKAFTVLKTLSSRTEEEKEQTISYLIGRGQGLTPSGDDILVGFTMVRKAFKGVDNFEKRLITQTALRNTTDISLAYYVALFQGYISSLFKSLIASIDAPLKIEVTQLIDRITLYGHTSGYDTLFGVYLGLQSLINEMEE